MVGIRNLVQDITYWAPSTYGGTGEASFASPAVLKGRWEDRVENILNASGDEIISRSRVFLASQVAIGGYLYLGTSATADPKTVDGALEIQQTSRIPDLRLVKTLHTAFL